MASSSIGFVGLGFMGEPMASNLAKKFPGISVWNRTPGKAKTVEAAGATVFESLDDLFASCTTIILMLATEAAMDEVLGRGTSLFQARVKDRTFVHMGTTSPSYSSALAADIEANGGSYVEAPVSGSRKPAQDGQLVAMTAGDPEIVRRLEPMLLAMCRQTFHCGAVPSALQMKLAVNLFLITTVAGLTEAFHMACRGGLDPSVFRAVVDNGPMSSSVSRMKLEKLLNQDFAVQASITDVLKNNQLVAAEARRIGIASPLIDVCHSLFGETKELGHGGLDMIGVLKAIEERTARAAEPGPI